MHNSDNAFDFRHFALFPKEYRSAFLPFTRSADILITAHYWDPASPYMISLEDMQQPGFRIRLIADISCDVHGPIVSTVRASTIEEPFYDFDPIEGQEKTAFSSDKNISVMAVDNLPAELPRDSSESFGETLLIHVFPAILGDGTSPLLDKATIVKEGKITAQFSYLEDWVMK
jgi:alanine dehydrogenase